MEIVSKYIPNTPGKLPSRIGFKNKGHYIYFLIWMNEIIYVGKTSGIGRRVVAHKNPKIMQWSLLRIMECPKDKLDHYERRWINKFKPIENRCFYVTKRRRIAA